MKKILLLIFVFIMVFAFSKNVYAMDPDSYLEEPIIPEFDRIEKIDGIMYGIIEIDNINIFTANVMTLYNDASSSLIDYDLYYYYLEFSFSRDTKYLESIRLRYTADAYCSYRVLFCIIPKEEYSSGDITYYYDHNSVALSDAKTITEAFGDGDITYSADLNYDYVIDLNFETFNVETSVSLEVLEFVYVLTDEEVIAVNEEIQQQYDNEVNYILKDGSLDINEKDLALADLNEEYSDYYIEFNEEITSLCLDDNCVVDYIVEDTTLDPSFWDSELISSIIHYALITLAILIGIALFYQIIIYLIKSIGKVVWKLFLLMINAILTLIVKPFINGIIYILEIIFKNAFWFIYK